jgi:hypothetical protein
MYAIQDMAMANKEVGIFKKPCRMLDQNSGWIGLIGRGINNRVEVGGRGKEHSKLSVLMEWERKKGVFSKCKIVQLFEWSGEINICKQ